MVKKRIGFSQRMLGKGKKEDDNENPSWLIENDNEKVNEGDTEKSENAESPAPASDAFGECLNENSSLLNKGKSKKTSNKWWSKGDTKGSESVKKVIVIDASTVSRGGLLFFDIVNNVATVTSLCLLLSQVLPIFFMNDSTTTIGPVQMALRCYMSVFCIGAICAEQEVLMINKVPLLHSWILRGLVYSFLGLVGLEESAAINYKTSGTPSLSFEDASVFILMSSFAMVIVGVLYFLMGIVCLRLMRDNLREKYNAKIEKEIMKREKMNEDGCVAVDDGYLA